MRGWPWRSTAPSKPGSSWDVPIYIMRERLGQNINRLQIDEHRSADEMAEIPGHSSCFLH